MILVIRQAFVDLGPRQIGETPYDIVNAGTVDNQTHHVMYAYSSAVYDRISSTDIGQIDQVTVTSRWHAIDRTAIAGRGKADFGLGAASAPTTQTKCEGNCGVLRASADYTVPGAAY
jgi:hypothetical protein